MQRGIRRAAGRRSAHATGPACRSDSRCSRRTCTAGRTRHRRAGRSDGPLRHASRQHVRRLLGLPGPRVHVEEGDRGNALSETAERDEAERPLGSVRCPDPRSDRVRGGKRDGPHVGAPRSAGPQRRPRRPHHGERDQSDRPPVERRARVQLSAHPPLGSVRHRGWSQLIRYPTPHQNGGSLLISIRSRPASVIILTMSAREKRRSSRVPNLSRASVRMV
jgi:hypothetical protein